MSGESPECVEEASDKEAGGVDALGEVEEFAKEGLEVLPGYMCACGSAVDEFYGGVDFVEGHGEGHSGSVYEYAQPSDGWGWWLCLLLCLGEAELIECLACDGEMFVGGSSVGG